MYGCVTWSPKPADYDRLGQVHHQMILRCLGWWNRKREHHTLYYAHAHVKTESESIEATVNRRRMFQDFVASMGKEHLPSSCLGRWSGVWATPLDRRRIGWGTSKKT